MIAEINDKTEQLVRTCNILDPLDRADSHINLFYDIEGNCFLNRCDLK